MEADYSFRDFARDAGERNQTVLHSVLRGGRRCTVDMLWRWRPVLGLPETQWRCLLHLARVEEAAQSLRTCQKRRAHRESADAERQELLNTELLQREEEALREVRKITLGDADEGSSQNVARLRTADPDILSAIREADRVIRLPVPEGAPPRVCWGGTLATGPETRAFLKQALRRIQKDLQQNPEDGPILVEAQCLLFPLSHRCVAGGAPAAVLSPTPTREPDIFDWGNPGDSGILGYLRAWFDWKKNEDPSFSLEKFADLAQQHDRTILYKVLTGRQRLTAARALQFAQGGGEQPGMELANDQTEYFIELLRRDRRRGPGQEDVQAGLDNLRTKARLRNLFDHPLATFQDVLPWILKELAQCPGFQPDLEWMAAQLIFPFAPDRIQQTWAALRRYGLDKLVEVAIEGKDRNVDSRKVYHYAVKSMAIQAFDPSNPAPDPTEGFSLRQSCSPARSRWLHHQLENWFHQIRSHCVAATEVRDQVVQINFHVWEDHSLVRFS